MYVVSKTFEFAAAHHLPGLPEGHKCRRPHGHNYGVTLVLSAEELDAQGMVLDYAALDVFRDWLRDEVDHRDLNELTYFAAFGGRQTTAEVIAYWLYTEATRLLGIGPFTRVALDACTVSETLTTSAEYIPAPAGP